MICRMASGAPDLHLQSFLRNMRCFLPKPAYNNVKLKYAILCYAVIFRKIQCVSCSSQQTRTAVRQRTGSYWSEADGILLSQIIHIIFRYRPASPCGEAHVVDCRLSLGITTQGTPVHVRRTTR